MVLQISQLRQLVDFRPLRITGGDKLDRRQHLADRRQHNRLRMWPAERLEDALELESDFQFQPEQPLVSAHNASSAGQQPVGRQRRALDRTIGRLGADFPASNVLLQQGQGLVLDRERGLLILGHQLMGQRLQGLAPRVGQALRQ